MSAEPEDRVRYVVAGMPTGWAAMSKTIRELDEDKVKDYKEDIDTLLVFTGLFSAVLTAFVIVSYPMLAPNPQDTTNQYLAQISAQTNSYTVLAGAINSTDRSNSQFSPPFTPSLAALRINYCWFASLIASLVTASFSILVKQWLREYLAYEYTSPQERLRARQFRHPGMATWKVYEIAGALPLLLQVALGLFFLGLCFFTRSDDHGIGDMCSALVALWASFVVTATIAPAFFSQCPYKTPFLKPVMKSLRHRHVIHTPRYCWGIVHYCWSIVDRLITVLITLIFYPLSVSLILYHRLKDPQMLFDSIFSLPASAIWTIITSIRHIVMTLAPYIQSASLYEGVEEGDAIKASTNELSLLAEVDGALLDDDLLGTTMLDSVKQSDAKPSDIIGFVVQATSFRLRGNALQRPLTRLPNLQRLSRRGWIAVSDIVAAALQTTLSVKFTASAKSDDESWIQEAFCLLFADSNQQSTSNAQNTVLRVLRGTIEGISPQVTNAFGKAAASITADRYTILMGPILSHFHMLLSRQEVQHSNIVAFVNTLLTEAQHPFPSLSLQSPFLQSVSKPAIHPVWQFCLDLLGPMIEEYLELNQKGREIGPWLEDATRILLALSSSYRLSRAGSNALIRLCSEDTLRERVALCIRSSPFVQSDIFVSNNYLDTFQNVQSEKLIAFAITLLTGGAHHTGPLSSTLDLRSVSKPAWQFSTGLLGAMIKDYAEQSQVMGLWLENAIYILLSPSPYQLSRAGNDALVRLCSGVTLQERLASCIRSVTSSIGEVFVCDHPLDALRKIQPEVIVVFAVTLLTQPHHPAPSIPLPSVLDLLSVSEPTWQFSSNLLGATIEACLRRDSGPWLEDVIHILLSPSIYPLTSIGGKALARIRAQNAPSESLKKCIQLLASPTHKGYIQVLSRLQDSIMCQDLPDNGYSNWCLKEAVQSLCTTRCTHSTDCLAHILADHAFDHEEWTKHFTSILVERCKIVFNVVGGTWPPGSEESIRALMSLPVSSHMLNQEIPGVVFALICSTEYSTCALRPLVSVEPEWQSWVVPDAAVYCVTSLVANANVAGRQTFVRAMRNACSIYVSDERDKAYPQARKINPLRHLALANTIHSKIQSDQDIFKDWVGYYTTCAKAIRLFHGAHYRWSHKKEQGYTERLAQECLEALDNMEPALADFDAWEAGFNVEASVFPDVIFEELMAFVASSKSDAAAQSFKRVRRLRKTGVIPGGEVSSEARSGARRGSGGVNIMWV